MNSAFRLNSAEGKPFAGDFGAAARFGPYRVGEKAFYFREGLQKMCLPYGSFDQVFKRSMLCSARHCGGVDHFDTFWLVFCGGDAELCAAKTIDEKHADAAMAALKARLTDVKFGL